jgi:hypothetical protein
MNLYFILIFIFGLFYQINTNIIAAGKKVVETADVIFSSVDFVRNVWISSKESGNLLEFIDNIEEQERRQKILEGKLREIQTSLYELKKIVEKIGFKIDLRHFETNVVYRMKQIYHAVQKFLTHPLNSTKNGLILQCRIHPPNTIMDILNELLHDDWLINQAKSHNYESPALEELIAKLDKIVETLVVSQAACSGVLDEAQYDFPRMVDTLKNILGEVRRSEAVVHRNYFNYTQTFVKEFLLDYSKKNNLNIGVFVSGYVDDNAIIAAELLSHFRKKYNYGPLYTIGVGRDSFIYYYSGMTFFGNLKAEHSYTVKQDKLHVFVLRTPSICDAISDVHEQDLVSINDNAEKRVTTIQDLAAELSYDCSKGQDYSEWFDVRCGQNYTCFYGQGCDKQDIRRVFISNGGLCIVYYNNKWLWRTHPIIVKSFPTNYVFQPIAKRKLFFWLAGRVADPDTKIPNVIFRTLYDEKSFIFTQKENINDSIPIDPIEYIVKKSLFMEQNFEILTKIKLTKHFEITTTKAQILSSSTKESDDIQKYSTFKAGHNYIFRGKIFCANGNLIGDKAFVNLIEVDDFSNDDVVASMPIKDGLFAIKVGSEYADFMSSEIELLIRFFYCCGYDTFRSSGILRNGTRTKYTLLDEIEYARVSKHHIF